MTFTAWSHEGEWYGLRVSKKERNTYFSKQIEKIFLELPIKNDFIRFKVNVTPSFWNNCPELRSAKIRNWFNACGYARPTTIEPLKFQASFITPNTIRVKRYA